MSIEKFKACLLLASFGDSFGFKNGEWEFNSGIENPPLDISINYILEFIAMGGINHINLKGWYASDDTLLQMAITKALLSSDNYINNCMEEFINIRDDITTDKRLGGLKTFESLTILKKTRDPLQIIYQESAGGNGASIRSMAIGLAFSGSKNRNTLIEYSIEIGRLTHNHVYGYLGSLVTALFVSYGLENIHPIYWSDKLLKLYESGMIDSYIDKKGRDTEQYHKHKDKFFNLWKIFSEKFKERSLTVEINILEKLRLYERYFSPQVHSKNGNTDYSKIGASGIDSLIIAYDSLLISLINKDDEHGIKFEKLSNQFKSDSKIDIEKKVSNTKLSWEKLVVHSMLHVGDSDSTGTIAASWFGAYQGFKGVPEINYKFIEFYTEINNLSEKLYNKFKDVL